MDDNTVGNDKGRIEKDLLDRERGANADWFTKIAKVERAKTLRREAQKAREGKPITFSEPGGWSRR